MKIEFFYRAGCQHNCPMAVEMVNRLKKKFPEISIKKYDTDNAVDKRYAKKRGVAHVPTVIINDRTFAFPFVYKDLEEAIKNKGK